MNVSYDEALEALLKAPMAWLELPLEVRTLLKRGAKEEPVESHGAVTGRLRSSDANR